MKSYRGRPVEKVECIDANLNIFSASGGGRTLLALQPRRRHSSEHRTGWKDLSPETLHLYRRKFAPKEYYDPKYRCSLPLYRGEAPGFLPLVMVSEERIVGFADMIFDKGPRFPQHGIPEDEVGCSMNLCVIDKHQSIGIGGFYSRISVLIARHFGAQWALGNCVVDGAMYHLRMKDGWETVSTSGRYAVIKKQL